MNRYNDDEWNRLQQFDATKQLKKEPTGLIRAILIVTGLLILAYLGR